jgi:hypothetical protein
MYVQEAANKEKAKRKREEQAKAKKKTEAAKPEAKVSFTSCHVTRILWP